MNQRSDIKAVIVSVGYQQIHVGRYSEQNGRCVLDPVVNVRQYTHGQGSLVNEPKYCTLDRVDRPYETFLGVGVHLYDCDEEVWQPILDDIDAYLAVQAKREGE